MTRIPESPFEAVTFDLFDTLVEIDEARLPRMSLNGVTRPSLLAGPFRRLVELLPDANVGEALVAYAEVSAELECRRAAGDHREDPPHLHFARCLERIGCRDEAVARELSRAFMETSISAARLADGAIDLLTSLQARGCTLGLISNLADATGGRALLSSLGLDRCFDVIAFSGEAHWRKPSPQIFELAVRALGIEPASILHVGDELSADIQGAGSFGLSTIWVNRHGARFEGEHRPWLQVPGIAPLRTAIGDGEQGLRRPRTRSNLAPSCSARESDRWPRCNSP